MAIILAPDTLEAAPFCMTIPEVSEVLASVFAASDGQIARTSAIEASVAALSGLSFGSISLDPFPGIELNRPIDL